MLQEEVPVLSFVKDCNLTLREKVSRALAGLPGLPVGKWEYSFPLGCSSISHSLDKFILKRRKGVKSFQQVGRDDVL